MNEDVLQRLSLIESTLANMESKVEDLWIRPRMPFTQNAIEGDLLVLEADAEGNLVPVWDSV